VFKKVFKLLFSVHSIDGLISALRLGLIYLYLCSVLEYIYLICIGVPLSALSQKACHLIRIL